MDIMVKTNDDEFSKKLLDFLKEHEAYLADDPVYADRMVWSAYDSHEIEEQVKLALELDDSYGINEFYSLQEITDMVMDEIDREIQNGQNLDHDMVIDNINSTWSNLEQAAEALHDARDNMENKHIPPLRQAELLKAIQKVETPFGIHEHHNGLYPDGACEEISQFCTNVLKPLKECCLAVMQNNNNLLMVQQAMLRSAVADYEEKRPAYLAGAVMFTDAPDTPHALNDATYACETVKSGQPCEEAIHHWMWRLAKTAENNGGLSFVQEAYKATRELVEDFSPAFRKRQDMEFLQTASHILEGIDKTIPECHEVKPCGERKKTSQQVK